MTVRRAKTDEVIKMPFEIWTWVGQGTMY